MSGNVTNERPDWDTDEARAERAAIVAWLRQIDPKTTGGEWAAIAYCFWQVADHIESACHHTENEPHIYMGRPIAEFHARMEASERAWAELVAEVGEKEALRRKEEARKNAWRVSMGEKPLPTKLERAAARAAAREAGLARREAERQAWLAAERVAQ